MKPNQRRNKIAEAVDSYGAMSVDALASQFDVSAETIRRDLGRLADLGALQKVHGGARPVRLLTEGSFGERMAEDAAAKQVIADKLAQLIEPGDTIFIDTGSTTVICARALAAIGHLTVITNSVRVAEIIGQTATNTVYLLGGAFGSDNGETSGPMVLDQIALFQADHAIITVAAIDADVGAMDADFAEAQVARAMMAASRQTVVLAHGEKLRCKAAFRICRLDQIDVLVCDLTPDLGFLTSLAAAGCALQ